MAIENEKLALLLSSMVLVQLTSTQRVPNCTNGEIRLVPRPGTQWGVIQYCSSGTWRLLCTGNGKWTTNEAMVACRQLGYNDQRVSQQVRCDSMWTGKFFRIAMNCIGIENTIVECGGVAELESCPGGCNFHGWLRCTGACSDGDIRLVGSNSEPNREGRVEVCINGHWGTVCNEDEDTARAVCSQLGPEFSPDATEVRNFGPGFVPISRCMIEQERENLRCSLITDTSCDHSMDLGVVCRTYEQLYNELHDQCSSTDSPMEDCVSTPVLGGVVGVLVTVLMVLVIGWSLSCVVLVKRKSQSQKQTQQSLTLIESRELHPNPSYGVNTQPHNCSSNGPAYELVDTKKGATQTYSILEQGKERGKEKSAVPKTMAEDQEHYYHVLESGEPESVTGEACDYEVPVTNSQI